MDRPETDVIQVQAEGDQLLPGDATDLTTPSGLVVRLQDVVWNAPGPEGLTLRFRFVAPAIAGAGEDAFAIAVRRHAVALPDLRHSPLPEHRARIPRRS